MTVSKELKDRWREMKLHQLQVTRANLKRVKEVIFGPDARRQLAEKLAALNLIIKEKKNDKR